MPPTETLLFFGFLLIWLGGWIVASISFRISRGKPIFPSVPDDAVYAERWGSGRNLAIFWGRFGGANNCLVFAVTRDRLVVLPRFPFNLMFLPEILGLEFDVALEDLTNVERSRFFWRDVATISTRNGQRFELYPRRIDEFMAALGRRWT